MIFKKRQKFGPEPNILPKTRKIQSEQEIARSYTRLFQSDDGQRVLDHLQLSTLYRPLSPDIDDKQLRHLEGQRFLVGLILRMIERGKSPQRK